MKPPERNAGWHRMRYPDERVQQQVQQNSQVTGLRIAI